MRRLVLCALLWAACGASVVSASSPGASGPPSPLGSAQRELSGAGGGALSALASYSTDG